MAFGFMQSIYFIYLLVICTCKASQLHHDEECLALLEFKLSISHPSPIESFDVGGFQKLDSWRKIANNASDHDSDCCLWDGVACSNHGRVIELDLSKSSLHGPIKSNSSLFNLVHLQKLNLSLNNFVGSQIPFEIARLKKLKSLDLSNSSFSGQIPIEISHLMQLTFLDLSWNSLKLQSPNSFGDFLQNLTRLEALHLSGVEISSFIPPFIANFSSLKSVVLQSCLLRDEFPTNIFNLPKLKFLNMADNPMLNGFLPEFQNNTLLEHLDLHNTSFVGSIPESIGKLNHLVFLNFLGCYFSRCFICPFSNMTQLAHLALGQDPLSSRYPNPVDLQVCEKVCMHDSIRKLTKLESLVLVGVINIHEEILSSLANLTKLSYISVRRSPISGQFPSSFFNLTQLSVIDLAENQLEGQISSSFSNFKNLKYLNLQFNKFSGKLDLDTFVGLTKLESLLVDDNRLSFVDTKTYHTTNRAALLPELKEIGLSSCNLSEFPGFLRFQTKLRVILLFHNKIEGLVPEWFLNNNQKTLMVLDLSQNHITGFYKFPRFLPWVHLEAFNIIYNHIGGRLLIPPKTTLIYIASYNNFIGEIPPQICEVKSLQLLDLSSNNMTGTLPSCFGNFSNFLSVLDLKRNSFHGPMMNSFMKGSLINRIDLSDNQFTGKLSESLANCTILDLLALGGNSFEDVFPFWLGTLANLQVLILRNNKFFGEIKGLSTASRFPKLRIVDLSNNCLSGQLPEKLFQTWNAMKPLDVGKSTIMQNKIYIERASLQTAYTMTITNKGVNTEYQRIFKVFTAIDFSCNSFEGHIPESLSDLQALQSINLSNNHLTGYILPSLGNLKNLESLDLSQNKLSGKIPQELLQLGFLEIFNVSFNNLHGSIPQGKQFYTFDNNSYMGNPELCGTPLFKICQTSVTPTLPHTNNKYESFLPSDKIDWIIILLGVGTGLVIGSVAGNLLFAKYIVWFIESSRKYKRAIRPLRNTRRN